MKIQFLSAVIALMIVITVPANLLAQNNRDNATNKDKNTEEINNQQKAEENVAPVINSATQESKTVKNEKEGNYEKSSDTRKNESLNQKKKASITKANIAKNKKTREKEMKEAQKARKEKARAAQKEREKKMKEREKERAKAAKAKKEARKELSK